MSFFTTFETDEKKFRLKKLFYFYVLAQLLLALSISAIAQFQPTEVVRSQERTIVDGKIFYIHTVQKGQTLYSISKAYEVTQDEIKLANPQVDVINLREGLAIKIPMAKPAEVAIYPQNREDYIAHDVRRGQTIYSLARKYRIDEEVIYSHNPWAREGIKPGQTLWIPKDKQAMDKKDVADNDDLFYTYTVKERDTLYAISRTYGVEVADIISANPALRNGMRSGMVLRIPKILPGTGLTAETDTLIVSGAPCTPVEEDRVYNVALMLPFFAKIQAEELELPVDSTLAEDETFLALNRQKSFIGKSFAEFYEGFLLALDSLKKAGLSVNLSVYDTERDTVIVKNIVRELSVTNPDLIVGPVYTEDVNITGRLARYNNIQLVSPLSTRSSLVQENSSIIQVIPSREAESYALGNYISQVKQGRIVLIRGTDNVSMRNSWIFKKYLTENMPRDESGMLLSLVDYRLNDSLINVIGKVLSKEEENLIVVFSDNEADVSRLVTRLFTMTSMYPVKLIGMPSWQSWKSIDLNYYHSLQLNLITPFYIDWTSKQVRRFLALSRARYGYEPYEIRPLGYSFGMLGYDIGLHFLSALRIYGKNFLPCINNVGGDQLLTGYQYQQIGQGGYMNGSFSMIRYNKDFTVERIAVLSSQPVVKPAEPAFTPVIPSEEHLPPLPVPVQ
ncbi:MAG: LysM peptidoglycan-binding domain-containing protein [Bacteroidales bacterium]|nr:LysM peptidoglycan-binding domain-containing protein [Bacteroidales bacterium]